MTPELKRLAALAMQGMLAHPTRYKPRPQDAHLHWHDAIARDAVELAEALGRAFEDVPHRPAAFINAINEEGTKAEAIEYLQQTWNELCEARARIRELEAVIKGLINNEDPAWDPIAFYNARAALAKLEYKGNE